MYALQQQARAMATCSPEEIDEMDGENQEWIERNRMDQELGKGERKPGMAVQMIFF